MQNTGELVRQGLTLTAIGMGLVFAALALVWAVIAALGRLWAPEPEEPARAVAEAGSGIPEDGRVSEAEVTAERARVAAIVAGALMANALPLLLEPSPGPSFEHGRTAPAWVTTNRARVMRPWQPPRAADDGR